MKVVGLVSGGKDSCYSLMRCVALGHEIVAVGNLAPAHAAADEVESHMFQTIGHGLVKDIAQCIGAPFFSVALGEGGSRSVGLQYEPTAGDEVEDLVRLLSDVKAAVPDLEAVASGAILSNYQRLRVEHVCTRLGLTSLAPLWEKDQPTLLREMISNDVDAVLVKVASMGLSSAHLGRTLRELEPHLNKLGDDGVNVCGEGGEYETLTLDCPLFRHRIVLDETELVGDLHTAIAPVAVLRIKKWHLEEKKDHDPIAACRAMKLTALATSKLEPLRLKSNEQTSAVASATASADSIAFASSSSPFFASFPSSTVSPVFPSSNVVADHCFVSTAASGAPSSDSSAVSVRVAHVLQSVASTLVERGFAVNGACYMQFFLESMSTFAEANGEYKQHISMQNAPSRACVQLATPRASNGESTAAPLAADCVAVRAMHRDVLHVQSISEWAPCCIGPYSQASAVSP
jgi:diphthine-ammonia ligase